MPRRQNSTNPSPRGCILDTPAIVRAAASQFFAGRDVTQSHVARSTQVLSYAIEAQGQVDALQQITADGTDEAAQAQQMLRELENDDEWREYAGVDSFAKFIDWEARQGVELSSARGGGAALNLGYYGSYVYWLVEILIVAAIAWGINHSAANEPFCTQCDQWLAKEEISRLQTPATELTQIIESGDLTQLTSASDDENLHSTLSVYCCPACSGDAVVQVGKLVKNNGTLQGTEVGRFMYPRVAVQQLRMFFAPPMQEWELAQEKATLESLQALEGEMAGSLREPRKEETSPEDDRLAVG